MPQHDSLQEGGKGEGGVERQMSAYLMHFDFIIDVISSPVRSQKR